MLSVKNLNFSYKKNRKTLNDISFDVAPGNVLVLLGPNGSGKSTILKCIVGLNKIEKEQVFINKVDFCKVSFKNRAKNIAYVSQEGFNVDLTVFDTILLGRLPYNSFYESKDDIEIVNKIIEKMNLQNIQEKLLSEISGGEKQKVLIAKALAQETPIIVLDEPTNNLDVSNQIELIREIKRIAKDENKIILISMHDINLALSVGDEFVLLKEGNLFRKGDKEIINEETINDLFNIKVKIINEKENRYAIFKEN